MIWNIQKTHYTFKALKSNSSGSFFFKGQNPDPHFIVSGSATLRYIQTENYGNSSEENSLYNFCRKIENSFNHHYTFCHSLSKRIHGWLYWYEFNFKFLPFLFSYPFYLYTFLILFLYFSASVFFNFSVSFYFFYFSEV